MKNNKSKIKRVARYGVALSSIFVANEIQADIDTITWNGGQPDVGIGEALDVDQLPNQGNNYDFAIYGYYFSSCVGSAQTACATFSFSSIYGGYFIAGLGSFDFWDL